MLSQLRENDTGKRDPRLIRVQEVIDTTGLTRNQLYTQMRLGQFPRPVKIGLRATAWVWDEVSSWIASRIAKRDAQ